MQILYVIIFISSTCFCMESPPFYKYISFLENPDEAIATGFLHTGNYHQVSWNKKNDTYSGKSYKQQPWSQFNARAVLGLADKGMTVLSEDNARKFFVAILRQFLIKKRVQNNTKPIKMQKIYYE